ncbi:hypothetical protein M231_07945, partial [Tremella mesenterica]
MSENTNNHAPQAATSITSTEGELTAQVVRSRIQDLFIHLNEANEHKSLGHDQLTLLHVKSTWPVPSKGSWLVVDPPYDAHGKALPFDTSRSKVDSLLKSDKWRPILVPILSKLFEVYEDRACYGGEGGGHRFVTETIPSYLNFYIKDPASATGDTELAPADLAQETDVDSDGDVPMLN